MKFVCLLANIGCCQLFCCIQIACNSISQISSRFFQLYILHFLCFVRKKQKQDETTTATYYDNRQRPGCGLSVPKQIIASAGEKGWTLVNGSRCYEWTGCDFVVGCGWCLKGGHLRDVFAYLETWLLQAVWDLHFKIYVERYVLKVTNFHVFPQSCRCVRWVIFFWSLFLVRISHRLCFKWFYLFFQGWDGQISHWIVMDTQNTTMIQYVYVYTSWGTWIPDKTLLLSSSDITISTGARMMNRHARGRDDQPIQVKDDMWIQVWVKVTLPKTNGLPLKMVLSKFGISKLPGVCFRGRTLSFRDGTCI